MTTKILTQAQAEAVYSAMCALNNVGGRIGAALGDGCMVREDSDGEIYISHDVWRLEYHADQAAFATAYGLQ